MQKQMLYVERLDLIAENKEDLFLYTDRAVKPDRAPNYTLNNHSRT